MSEEIPKYINLAERIGEKKPSLIQRFREYFASLLGDSSIVDEKLMKTLQKTSDDVGTIMNK